MMDEAKTAGTESAPPAGTGGAGGAAAAADAAERPPTIPADEIARLTDEIVAALKTVYDPEIPADLYELGLIYKVGIDDDRMVTIDMTLTTPNCPSAARTRSRACPACAKPRSISSGIRRGTPAACRMRLARCSICGDEYLVALRRQPWRIR